jgi:Saxitoxin biosynthesis operon protein SxtJ
LNWIETRMLRDEIRQLKTGDRELRNFGLLVGGVFVLLGVFCGLRGKAYYPWLLLPGVSLVLLGMAGPKVLKHIYIGWMSLALVLGFVVSHVILTLFFFLVISPLGLVARLAGKDFLRRKLEPQAKTYWLRRARPVRKSPSDYERQF